MWWGMFECIDRLLWGLWDLMGGSGVHDCLPGLEPLNQEANTDLFNRVWVKDPGVQMWWEWLCLCRSYTAVTRV